MTFNEYQQAAWKTAVFPDVETIKRIDESYWEFSSRSREVRTSISFTYPLIGLIGEIGEVAEKLKKHIRDGTPLDKEQLTKEMGDVLWYWAALATTLHISAEEIARVNLDKLMDRKNRGVLKGEGDNR